MLRLTGVSFAHPRLGADARAAASVPVGGVTRAPQRWRADGHDVFFLVTCLRVEVAWLGGPETVDRAGSLIYGSEGFGPGEVRHDQEAFHHLARVAAGLESPLVGEPEVLGQFRRAMKRLTGTEMGSVLEGAIGAARAARRLLEPAARGSLAIAAADIVSSFTRVAVLGAGAMARATLLGLADADVTVYARRQDPVCDHHPRPWSRLDEALASFPAVVSTVPGKFPIRARAHLQAVVDQRSEPLVLVDLGMPPAVPARGMPGVRYLGIDDLAASVGSPTAVEADARVARESATTWRRLAAPGRAGSVIAAVQTRADMVVAEEVRRLAPRLSGPHAEEILHQLARRVSGRILHPPISFLAAADDALIDVLAEAFGVDE